MRSTPGTRLVAGAIAVTSFTLMVAALTGVGHDWLGGWLMRCGGRFSRHACEAGEVPWRFVFGTGTAALVALLVATGPVLVLRRA